MKHITARCTATFGLDDEAWDAVVSLAARYGISPARYLAEATDEWWDTFTQVAQVTSIEVH